MHELEKPLFPKLNNMITQELNGWRSHFKFRERLVAKSGELLLVLRETLEEGVEDDFTRVHRLQDQIRRKHTLSGAQSNLSHICTRNLPGLLDNFHFFGREFLHGRRNDFGVAWQGSMQNVSHHEWKYYQREFRTARLWCPAKSETHVPNENPKCKCCFFCSWDSSLTLWRREVLRRSENNFKTRDVCFTLTPFAYVQQMMLQNKPRTCSSAVVRSGWRKTNLLQYVAVGWATETWSCTGFSSTPIKLCALKNLLLLVQP